MTLLLSRLRMGGMFVLAKLGKYNTNKIRP